MKLELAFEYLDLDLEWPWCEPSDSFMGEPDIWRECDDFLTLEW